MVELEDGLYEKYDSEGNRIDLDLFGFEVEQLGNDEVIRYDKVGNVVDEEQFEEKLREEEKMELLGMTPTGKLKRFKPKADIDLEGEFSKMLQE